MSLSPFFTSFSVVVSRISILTFLLYFSLLLYSTHCADPVFLFRSAYVSFLVLSTLSSFASARAAKFNLQFSLHALLYFPFAKSTKSFLLFFSNGQVQLASRILRMLCVNLIFLNFSRLFL